MPQFVIERDIPSGTKVTKADIRDGSLKSLEALQILGPDIRWLYSYITDDKIYCIYFAPDEALIHRHGELAGARVDRVSAVRHMVEPANFQ